MVEAQNPYPGPGETVNDRFRIEKLLGEGGMGAVARATHLVLGGPVALKFMNPQFMTFPGAVERFLNEGRASNAIKSDHVLPVTDVGSTENGTPFLVMECLYGLDLADLLARDGPSGLPVERAVHFTIQILRGLQAAHAINIIHRDMKPSNCFVVTHDGQEDFVKILDFGISKVVQPGQSSLTQTNSALGTPLYMSPEQARSPRDVDHRSDIYSVGVILYELLCGRTPFFSESGEFTEILFQLFTADPPPIRETRPDLPEALAAVVHRALSREVDDRYSSALEFAEALLPFASSKSAGLVDRMRIFKAPSKESIIPGDNGLPTSMAAFSQLARGHNTDAMPNRPTTDVQKGAPVTEVIEGTPRAAPVAPVQNKTAVLEVKPDTPSASSLGKAKTQFDPRVAAKPGVSTDLGAAVDRAEPPPEKRSPFIYLLPVGALAIGAAITVVFIKSQNGPTTTGVTPPETASTPSAVVSTAPPPPSVTPSAVVSAAPSASASAVPAVVTVAAPKPPPPTPAPAPVGHPNTAQQQAVDKGIKN